MTKTTIAEQRQQQLEMIEQSRRDSVTNPSIPLGFPLNARTEFGPDVINYYRDKHQRKKIFGEFFPLHQTAPLRFRD